MTAAPPPPPLTREALEQIPAVLENLRTLWSALATLAPEVHAGLANMDPERMPAPALALEVAWQKHLLEIFLQVSGRIHWQLFRVQEHDWIVDHTEFLAQEIEDDAAVTD